MNCLKQKFLSIEKTDDGGLLILEPLLFEPWATEPEEKKTLQAKELTVCFLSHSCIEINADGLKLILDPWLTGPCYGRSWWLLHEVEENLFNRVACSDGIFISKYSPDHFNLPTLRCIAKINQNIQIYIPEIIMNSCESEIKRFGFIHVKKIPFGVWENLRKTSSRFMILPDHKYPHIDIMFLFEYKGHRILNLVDCASPNGEYLPYNVDVLLRNFTANKNAFPSCFVEQYGEKKYLRYRGKKMKLT